ncbi:hypothetical protein ACSVDE_17225 [Pseudalkalibacillus sp. Hm43]|uniref:hypothetical protein n=1 Tax=Pseudalkalibacillus sp. Hm43 TaxID=3450742 RepID=UPI001CFA0F65
MQFITVPLLMALGGFLYGLAQGGLPTAISYALGFFIGGFMYRVLRHLLVNNLKNISPKR